MGLGPMALKVYNEYLKDEPCLQRGKSMIELGSQQVYWGVRWGTAARVLMEERGLRYACIDMDGQHGALQLDLNECEAEDVVRLLRGQGWDSPYSDGRLFDTVTNHGTSEHVIDQVNVFRLMHDLCKVGGIMLHLVPSWPWKDHEDSFYYYSATLFADLAHANDYEAVQIGYFEETNGQMVIAVLRRKHDAPFKLPIQGRYRGNGQQQPVAEVQPQAELPLQ